MTNFALTVTIEILFLASLTSFFLRKFTNIYLFESTHLNVVTSPSLTLFYSRRVEHTIERIIPVVEGPTMARFWILNRNKIEEISHHFENMKHG
jgi:hypothetical protein